MRFTKWVGTAMLCVCLAATGSPEKCGTVNAEEAGQPEAAVTFEVEKDNYTLTYTVLEEQAGVALTDCKMKENVSNVNPVVELEGKVKDKEQKEYPVTKIGDADGVFNGCPMKKYVLPDTVLEITGNPFEAEDIVIFKKVSYVAEDLSNKAVKLTNPDVFIKGVKAIIINNTDKAEDIVGNVQNGWYEKADGVPETIHFVVADSSSIGNYSILELPDGKAVTAMVKAGSSLSEAKINAPLVDYVTKKAVENLDIKWDKVIQGESEIEPEGYKVSEDSFEGNATKLEYSYTCKAACYVPYTGKVKLQNAMYTVTESGFTYQFELIADAQMVTAKLLSATAEEGNTNTTLTIPEKAGEYPVTEIGESAFSSLTEVNTYVIPDTIANIGEKAFYDNDKDENRVVLLRLKATDAGKLPAISGNYQKNDNKQNRFAMVFDKTLLNAYNDIRSKYGNTVGWNNEEFLQIAENDVLTDNLMYGGSMQLKTDVYYDPSGGKNTMQYVSANVTVEKQYMDFLTKAEVNASIDWGDWANYVFKYTEGKKDIPYIIKAAGYISIKKQQEFDPQSLSGYTYKMVNNELIVTGYKGENKELTLQNEERDAIGAYKVTGIGGRALTDDRYQKLTIPATIINIEPDAFVGANYMKIVVEAGNPYYIAIDDFLYSADKTTLIAAPSASGHVTLPEGTVKLGNYAFAGSKRVLSVIIPSTVTMIGTTNNGAYTFAWMQGFETLKFSNYNPSTITIMGNHMLEGSSLREVHYPTGTTQAYKTLLNNAGIYLNDNVKQDEWNPTYNTVVQMDGTEVKYVNPADSTKKYNWESSAPNVVIVEPSGSQGKLTAVGNGEAVITATAADGTSYKWTVTVTLSETVYYTTFEKKSVVLGKKAGKKTDSVTINTVSVPRGTKLKSVKNKNNKVAKVKLSKDKKGVVVTSGTKTGSTTVTVTDVNGKQAVLKVTVKKAPTAKSFKFKKTSVKLKKGATFQIQTKASVACQKMTYSLSKSAKKIVSVSKTGLVKAKKKGKAKITVKSYNGIKKTIQITVK